MKRLIRTKDLSSSFMAVALFAAITLSSGTAHALLKGFSPNASFDGTPSTFAEGALPTWFQGQDGIAVGPCITDLVKCGLAGTPVGTFDGLTVPMTFPDNYSSENFFFQAVTNPAPIGATGITAGIEVALEYMTIDAVGTPVNIPVVGVSTGVFQRIRIQIEPLAVPGATGTWTVDHPWGSTSFDAADCKKQNTGCQITIDVPGGLAPNSFGTALGFPPPVPATSFTMDTFLKSTTAPLGFLGDGVTPTTFTSGTGINSFTVSGPPGSTAPITIATIIGKTVGMEVTPPVGGNDFGVVKKGGPVAKTFTVNNLTGAILDPFVITALIPNSNPLVASPDFIITPSAGLQPCALGVGATLAVGAICDFDVTFAPSATAIDGTKTAAISISGSGAPPAQATVTGTADVTAPVVAITTISNFTKLATQTISGTVSDNTAVGGVNVSVDGLPAGLATVTAGTWTFNVPALALNAAHTIAVTANDTALPAVPTLGNITTVNDSITVDTLPPTVVVTSPVTLPPTAPTNVTAPALTFTAADNFNVASTIVKVDGGLPITAPPATLGPFADGLHTVDVVSTDSAGNITTVTNSFTIDATAPVITVTSPKPTNGRFGVISPILRFNVSDANPVPASTIVTLDGNVVLGAVSDITPLGPFTAGSSHTLTITTTDGAGNPSTTTTGAFTIVLADGRVVSLGAEPPAINDALATLRSAVQLTVLTPDQFAHADVAPLDASGIPSPNGIVDIADALLILRRVVGLVITF